MSARRCVLPGLVLWAAACLTAPAGAGAQARRVVVEQFGGPQGARLRASLIASLLEQDGIDVVGSEEVEAAAAELGLGGRTFRQDDYPAVAQRLNASAFIRGRVLRRRRAWSLTVSVRSGSDGSVLGTETWSGRTVNALGGIRRNGHERLAPYIDAGGPAVAQPVTPTPVTDTETPWYQRGGDDVDTERPGEDEDEEPVPGENRLDWLSGAVLFGTLGRSMQADALVLNNGRDPSMDPMAVFPETRSYSSPFPGHMEAGLSVEIYPGAIAPAQPMPWVGAVLSFRHSLFLNTVGCGERNPATEDCVAQVDVSTSQYEIYVGARGRYRFGELRRSPVLFADVGWGTFAFILDPAELKGLERPAIIPPIAYSYLHVGIGGSYGVVPTWLTVGGRVAYRLGLGIGDDAREVWGADTTDSAGFILGLDLRSEAPYIGDGFFMGATVEYFRFSTTFRGQTACVDAGADGECRVDDPWEPWPFSGDIDNVTGGIQEPVGDGYWRLSLAFGYSMR